MKKKSNKRKKNNKKRKNNIKRRKKNKIMIIKIVYLVEQ